MRGVRLLQLPQNLDTRGRLVALDEDDGLPFAIRRVFLILDCPAGAVRAEHAVSTHVALITPSGAVSVDLDDGARGETVRLEGAASVLCVHAGIWMRLRAFGAGTVVLGLASASYADVEYFAEPRPELLEYAAWT